MGPPVLSPDGRMLAFDATDSAGTKKLWLRPLDALESRSVPGTDGLVLLNGPGGTAVKRCGS